MDNPQKPRSSGTLARIAMNLYGNGTILAPSETSGGTSPHKKSQMLVAIIEISINIYLIISML